MPSLIPLSEIPTLSLLYKLQHLTAAPRSAQTPAPSQALNSLVSLIRTDITSLEVSAIVNAANISLLGGGGVDGAIHARAGPGLLAECEELDGCETGSAKITGAYELPCDKVIHAVGPVYWSAKRQRVGLEKELLAGCYRTSLDLASENGCKSIAFSAISTGVYGYPSSEAAEVAVAEVRKWIDRKGANFGGLERIVFCCFNKKDEIAYEDSLPKHFPPTNQDLHGHNNNNENSDKTEEDEADEEEEELLKGLPDPPAGEPLEHGQPGAKKQKTGKTTTMTTRDTATSEAGDDWESIERPDGTDVNGYPEERIEERRATSIDEHAMTQEEKERHQAALHTAQIGGDPPQSALERDW